MIGKIKYINEPKIKFGDNQLAIDPRDGLILYGPYEKWGKKFRFNCHSVVAGLIGAKESLQKFKRFVSQIKKPIISTKRNKRGQIVSNEIQRPSFPGFEAVFNIHWPEDPEIFKEISSLIIEEIFATEKNRRIRTSKIVDLYLNQMLKVSKEQDSDINIWFVIVPRKIYNNCRSKKGFGRDFSKKTIDLLTNKYQLPLFSEEEMYGAKISDFFESSSDFHHLLKARANHEGINVPIQIIVEPKLEFRDIERNKVFSPDMKAHFAWSLSTTLYYKLGKKPWKLANIREGVCYLGMVFKRFQNQTNKNLVCSAAQLFMDDGDGTVFRGNNGLWLSENEHEFHLDEKEAFNLMNLALNDYFDNNNKQYPKELFIHGRAKFTDNEWKGFQLAIKNHKTDTTLIGIIIKDQAPLKLFRDVENETSNYGVMRGTAIIIDENEAYLFTRGFIPRLNSSNSLEIPNPLHVKITKGQIDIDTVLQDIMALTKVNYNSCIYGDGKPVTLRFSDSIGSILTATNHWKAEKRQFKFYI